MTNVALFYAQAAPVSLDRHRNWNVDMDAGYAFSRHTNSVPLTTVEFEAAGREYPIVFAATGESVFPVVLLGLHDRENLFINEAGQWDGRYLPAFIRRYPFIFASENENQTYTLCIDEGFAGCNQDERGQSLFLEGGERSEYLERMLAFLGRYQAEHKRTSEFCRRLVDADILESVQANVELTSGDKFSMGGMSMVNRAKLKELGPEQVKEFFDADFLALIYAHLLSLGAFQQLVDRVAKAT